MASVDLPAHLDSVGTRVRTGLATLAALHGVPLQALGHPAITYFSFDDPSGLALQTLWTVRMLDRGFLVGGAFSPTLAHQPHHVDRYLAASEEVFKELGEATREGDAEKRIGSPVKHAGFRRLA